MGLTLKWQQLYSYNVKQGLCIALPQWSVRGGAHIKMATIIHSYNVKQALCIALPQWSVRGGAHIIMATIIHSYNVKRGLINTSPSNNNNLKKYIKGTQWILHVIIIEKEYERDPVDISPNNN